MAEIGDIWPLAKAFSNNQTLIQRGSRNDLNLSHDIIFG